MIPHESLDEYQPALVRLVAIEFQDALRIAALRDHEGENDAPAFA